MEKIRSDEVEKSRSKRERSPSFPYLDLVTAIQHLRMLYDAAKSSEVAPSDVATTWGMKPTSGSFLRYLSALSQYGLVESVGIGEGKRVKITSDGKRILEDRRPGESERLRSEAALKPRIIRGLFWGEDGAPHWGRDRPSDDIAESVLKFDLKFGADGAKRLINVYDVAVEHIVETDDSNIVRASVPIEADETDEIQEQELSSARPMGLSTSSVSAALTATRGERNKINFRSEDGETVYISATLDSEGLDMLEKKIPALRMLLG
jgi:DNA-binding PadR family transcriptional regulator